MNLVLIIIVNVDLIREGFKLPVTKDKASGRWRIGNGRPMYKTKASANKAYRGYLASKRKKKK